jgi:hypothetical protein
MHTATQLKRSQFGVLIDGESAEREALLPDWGAHDRLGVVVHEPFEALGASHLIQLAITAFYDERPARRAGKLRADDPLAIYPEVYLFHIGGIHVNHSWLDVFPPRKEVSVENEAALILEAINDRAITRLAVPDSVPVMVAHAWKEPSAARDRIVSAFAYSGTGRTQGADVEIIGLEPVTQFNVRKILNPDGSEGSDVSPGERADTERVLSDRSAPSGSFNMRAMLAAAIERRERLRDNGVVTETYRRIDLDDALNMLASTPTAARAD